MKIERINENQIRCTLSSFDLSVRNLNLGELAYGSEKARNLFREMIQKASNEVGFDAEDIPLMVEAIPLSNESVMLVITRIEDPEELDTRFSRFSPPTEDEDHALASSELLEGADNLLDFIKKELGGMPLPDGNTIAVVGTGTENQAQAPAQESEQAVCQRIYRFKNLDQVIDAAHAAGPVFTGSNTLYKNPDSGRYYLVISNEGVDKQMFSRASNILTEYGRKLHQGAAQEAYYREHYEIIVSDGALQKLMNL